MKRLSKKAYYMEMARTASLRSPCPEGKRHGAVIVVNDRPVATGYNGPSSKVPHCEVLKDGTCPLDVAKASGIKDWTACPAVHAEVNAIITAAMAGTSIVGGSLYVTKKPCAICMRILLNCKFKEIVWDEKH